MSKIFYISDTHFSHEAIIKFDSRPFETAEEMNEVLVNNWNSVVGEDDITFVIGDFMWRFRDEDFHFIKRLNGRKRLLKGNHDLTHGKNFKRLFEHISDYEKIKDGDKTVVLSHYPMLAYDGSFMGRNYHLYGHVHNTDEYKMIERFIAENKDTEHPFKMYNVGCMMPWMDYAPRTLEEIIERCD
jgi:calcineurin-like phosphoesterase family protein